MIRASGLQNVILVIMISLFTADKILVILMDTTLVEHSDRPTMYRILTDFYDNTHVLVYNLCVLLVTNTNVSQIHTSYDETL